MKKNCISTSIVAVLICLSVANAGTAAERAVPRAEDAQQYKQLFGPVRYGVELNRYLRYAPESMTFGQWEKRRYERAYRRATVLTTFGGILTTVGAVGLGYWIGYGVHNEVYSMDNKWEEDRNNDDEDDEHNYYGDGLGLFAIRFLQVGYTFMLGISSMVLIGGTAMLVLGILKRKRNRPFLRGLNKINSTGTHHFQSKPVFSFYGTGAQLAF